MLTIWVLAEDRLRIASTALAVSDAVGTAPLLQLGAGGTMMASPYVAIVARQSEIMLRAGAELGFTPASRPGLAVPPEAPAKELSPWERIQALRANDAT